MAATSPTPPHQLRPTRMAGLVADLLRERIISGELEDGGHLPKEEDLRAEFGVGKPAMREAMRILESEGLVRVIRGNRGGAIVRAPQSANTAYALGLVLASRHVAARDVGDALAELEPVCAALCAGRPTTERRRLVAELETIQAAAAAAIDDPDEVVTRLRELHAAIVAGCGNESLIITVGALEALWASHVTAATRAKGGRPRPREAVARSIAEHDEIVDAIRRGDVDTTRDTVSAHVSRVRGGPSAAADSSLIDVATIRAALT